MTPNEIIAMAEQAGYPHVGLKWNDQEQDFLMRFAALVAAREREACAQVCDAKAHEVRLWCNESNVIACATAIRERNSHVS
jgi:hypothetical protein